MGQYLCTGIMMSHSVSKARLEKLDISKDKLVENMVKTLCFCPELYDLKENDEIISFDIKQSVIENQLIPLLEELYPRLYPEEEDKRYSGYTDILEILKNTEPATWIDFACDNEYQSILLDDYPIDSFLKFGKGFNTHIPISHQALRLCSEGKTLMEVYGGQFNFFSYCIAQAFDSFSLAKAVRVYLSE